MKKLLQKIKAFFYKKKYWYVVLKMEVDTISETGERIGTHNVEMSVAIDSDPFDKLLFYMGESKHSKSISIVNQFQITEKQFAEFNYRLQQIVERQKEKLQQK